MARKILNRKALREEAEAAEEAGVMDENEELDEDSEDGDEEGKPKKKPKAKRKTKSKSKEPAEIRMKLYWGVYNQSMKRVALYDYSQRRLADQKAAELSQSGKTMHFVKKDKEPIKEG